MKLITLCLWVRHLMQEISAVDQSESVQDALPMAMGSYHCSNSDCLL